jgi:hypothetical protein
MADPVIVAITPADTWVKVAGPVTSGQIDALKSGPNAYLRTYVDAGGAAPSGKTKALRFFNNFQIESSVSIDVYVMAVGAVGEVLASL